MTGSAYDGTKDYSGKLGCWLVGGIHRGTHEVIHEVIHNGVDFFFLFISSYFILDDCLAWSSYSIFML